MAAPDTLPGLTDLTELAGLSDPFPALAALRERGRVVRMTMGPVPVWVVTRYDDVLAALSDPRLGNDPHLAPAFAPYVRDDVLSSNMLATDPPAHTRLRRLVSKAFTARRVEGLRPRIEQVTSDLLDRVTPLGRAELIGDLALPLPITVIGELLGVPAADRERFRSWTDDMLETPLDRRMDPEQMAAAAGQLRDYVVDLVAAKRRHPADDLLTGLIQVSDEEDGSLDEQELLSMAFLLLIAGYVTTVNLIGNGTLALLRAPDQLERLRADPSLVPGAVEEFLRLDGPVNLGLTRYAAEDLEIAGVPIPRGEVVLLATAAADRDPDRYPDPDRLDVTAEHRGHLGFGHGAHYCLGAPLARLEGRIAFTALLARLPEPALAVPVEELRWSAGGLRGPRALPVVFRPTPALQRPPG